MFLVNKKTNEAFSLSYDDEVAESPRWNDNLGTLWLFDSASQSDDGNHPQCMGDALVELIGEQDYQRLIDPDYHRYESLKDQFYRLGYKHGYLLQPVTRYEHTQVRYYRGAGVGFDYAICGVIFAPLKDIRQEYGVKRITKKIRQRVMDVFDKELATFTDYENGDVFTLDYYADASEDAPSEVMYEIYLSEGEFSEDPHTIYQYAKDYYGNEIGDEKDWVATESLEDQEMMEQVLN